MEDTLWSSLTDSYIQTPMALTAERLADKYDISREECDKQALRSQQRWAEGRLLSCQVMLQALGSVPVYLSRLNGVVGLQATDA